MSPRDTAWGAYKSITDALRSRIVAGEFAPGALLPSEAALCAEYRVARNTLRRALDQLADERLIEVHPGRGRVVASSPGSGVQTMPAYRLIAAELRALIESGTLSPGEAIPSEAELANRHQVARGTVRHALADLEGAGLVESVHGKGRFVRQR